MESIFVWCLSILFTVIGVGSFFHFIWIGAKWTKAVAEVTDNVAEYAKSGETGSRHSVYFAQLQFQSADGSTYTIKGDVGRRKPWRIGTNVLIQYKPSNPNHAITMRPLIRFLFSLTFLIFGLAGLASSLGYVS